MFEEDFVKDEVVEFLIDERKFGYKPVTAGEENEWANEYIEIVDGKPKQDFAKINKCKVRNLVVAPYTIEEKQWTSLNNEERWQILSKLKPAIFNKIFKKINEIDEGDNQKKN